MVKRNDNPPAAAPAGHHDDHGHDCKAIAAKLRECADQLDPPGNDAAAPGARVSLDPARLASILAIIQAILGALVPLLPKQS
jgi:hypothetical protein